MSNKGNEVAEIASTDTDITKEDILIDILKNQKVTNKEVKTLRQDVDDIKDNAPVHPSLNNHLTKARNKRVIEAMGGKDSKAYNHVYPQGSEYKKLSNKVFAEAGRDFKSQFDLATYAELPQSKYEEAKEYWESWEPSHNTKLEIKRINNQLELFSKEQVNE